MNSVVESKGLLGLSSAEAFSRLKEFGLNELKESNPLTAFDILKRQLVSPMLYILLVASIVSFWLNELVNFFVIIAIILVGIVLGFVQEYRAEKAMAGLKKLVHPMAKTFRDSTVTLVNSVELVPGDLVLLETGDRVPADARILESTSLKVDESILTGESNAVEKNNGDVVFAGTQIVRGKCKALVTVTGMNTKLGQIAALIQSIDEKTPLEKRLNNVSKNLALVAVAACILIILIGLYRGAPFFELLVIALALAVAAVPEGLPLTITLTLAYGMKQMARHNAIIRKMLAVETLGSVTVICADKTGTLTQNQMTVEKIYSSGKIFEVTGTGYDPRGEFKLNGKTVQLQNSSNADETLARLLQGAALCNDAIVKEADEKWSVIGDPTEASLVVVAAKAGYWKDELEKSFPRIEEILFTSERKSMTTIHKNDGVPKEVIAYTKGAPETVLAHCAYIEQNSVIVKLTKKQAGEILQRNSEFAASAYRTLAIAYRKVKSKQDPEGELVFLGLVAMQDPPREEVKQAIQTCKSAGIKVLMITGDNEETAKAIAKQIGLFDERNIDFGDLKNEKVKRIVSDGAITGAELAELTDEEFETVVDRVHVYARIMPEQKLRIVDALKKKGHVVAMTGDGVNDAPALKKADIGISMGLTGTEVAKEASSMVLQDDNFASIVEAVKQGRTIYNNVEKFLTYLTSRNFTEVILLLLTTAILGFQYAPLLAIQILFINTIGETLPSISLSLDPSRDSVMNKKPRSPNEQFFKPRNAFIVAMVASVIALCVFSVFMANNPTQELDSARTITFVTIALLSAVLPFAFRSLDEPLSQIPIASNKLMLASAGATVAIILVVLNYSPLQSIFGLVSLSLSDWFYPLATIIVIIATVEIAKSLANRFFTASNGV